MNKTQLLVKIGFSQNVTKEVIEGLNKKETKTNKEILGRIAKSEYYEVFRSENRFTIVSRYLVTTSEIKQLSKLLKVEFIEEGKLSCEMGIRSEWTKAANL